MFIITNMFVTNLAFRSPISDYFGSEAETIWSAVELPFFRPWFSVSYRQMEGEGKQKHEVRKTLLLADIQSVEQLVSQDCGQLIKFDSVQITTPGHMNGTTHWKMDVLRATWTALEPDADGQIAEIFETVDGIFYVHSVLDTPIQALKSMTIRFIAPTFEMKASRSNQ